MKIKPLSQWEKYTPSFLKGLFQKPESLVLFLSLVMGVGFTFIRFHQSFQQAEQFISNPDYDAEKRTQYWMQSAKVFRETGVFLSLQSPTGELTALENYSPGDDCGHALFLSLYSWLTSQEGERTELVEINFILNALGILSLALCLFLIGFRWASVLVLIVVSQKSLPGPIPGWDVYSVYIGVSCLALIPVLYTWSALFKRGSIRFFSFLAGLSFISLALAFLLRSPIAQIGVILSVPALFLLFIRNKREWRQWGAIFILLLLSAASRPLLLQVRNASFEIEKPYRMNGHGIWQTLFHGLGTEPNPWGISWADSYGLNHVKSIAPGVPYLSEDYQKIMRRLYFRAISSHPMAALKIYGIKAWKSFSLPLKILGMNFYLGTLIWLVLAFMGALYFPDQRHPFLLSQVVLAFLFIFHLQGILGIPWIKHLYPEKIVLLVSLFLGLEGGWDWLKKRPMISSLRFRN